MNPIETEFKSEAFTCSESPEEIDSRIKNTIIGIRISILNIGLGLANIKTKGLFKILKFKNMTQYINHLSEETKFDRSSIFNWLYIGEAYVKYREDLEKIGFGDRDGATKLPYLARALAVRAKNEVFDKIKTMSLREFINYSRGEVKKNQKETPYVNIRGNVVYVEGRRALILNKGLRRRTHAFFQEVIETACEALDKGGIISTFFFPTMRDARRFEREVEGIQARILSGKMSLAA